MYSHPKSLTILFLICCTVLSQLPIDDQVFIQIPGYTNSIYSGYFQLDVEKIKGIHYVYFQSQRNSSKDPIILWLEGGPACSALMSMLQQNGPFLIPPQTSDIILNKQAWNKRAGLIYFEAPSGVGYSENPSQQQRTEEQTIYELYITIYSFFVRFPNLRKNQFYIAGSGFGAVFAANLARRIIDQNNDESKMSSVKINIKGILLGNPCVYPDQCASSNSNKNSFYHYEFLYNRGFIPKPDYNIYYQNCIVQYQITKCYVSRTKLDQIYDASNTSAFNIYRKCYNLSTEGNTINLGCEDETGVIDYLNNKTFKQKWHIRSDKKWQPCNQKIYQHYLTRNGTFHLLNGLVKDNIRIWVYSGDMDSTVPITGTKFWVNRYKTMYQIPIKKNWRQWWIPGRHKFEDQVGGFIWQLEGLTVVVVKGAGYKAGIDQPVAMEQVLNGFLDGTTLPYKS